MTATVDERQIERIEPVRELARDNPIWTRQPDETDKEWAWFRLYRNLHPAKRSVRAAYMEYRKAKGLDWEHSHAPPQLETMQRRWSWQKRAIEYDVYLDREKNIAIQQAREEAVRETAELGRNMRRVAAIAVQALFNDLYEEQTDPETGATKIVFKEKLTPGSIVRLAKTGVELERLSLGLGDGRSPSPATTVNLQVGVLTAGGVQRTDDALLLEAAEIIKMREMQSQVVEGEYDEKC